jgi:hypothetical protein
VLQERGVECYLRCEWLLAGVASVSSQVGGEFALTSTRFPVQ